MRRSLSVTEPARYFAAMQDKVEFLKGVYAEWSKGNFAAGTSAYDENILLVMRPDLPDSGVYTGMKEVRGYMRGFLDPWEALTMEGSEFREFGDSVLVKIAQRGVGRLSGAEVELGYYHLWTFRGSRVIRLEVVPGEREALEAAGGGR